MNGLWGALRRQPVRAYLYGVLVPGVAVAGGYGWVSDDKAALWIALGAAILLPFGVEAARANVTPLARPRDNAGRELVALDPHPNCVFNEHVADAESDGSGTGG